MHTAQLKQPLNKVLRRAETASCNAPYGSRARRRCGQPPISPLGTPSPEGVECLYSATVRIQNRTAVWGGHESREPPEIAGELIVVSGEELAPRGRSIPLHFGDRCHPQVTPRAHHPTRVVNRRHSHVFHAYHIHVQDALIMPER